MLAVDVVNENKKWKKLRNGEKQMKAFKWIRAQIMDEKGSATIEGAIWIPFIFIAVLCIIKILFQWTELGVVQGEVTYFLSEQVTYDSEIKKKNNKLEYNIKKFDFLQNPTLKIQIEGNEYVSYFKAGQQAPLSPYIEQKICIKMENPIKKLRGRERVESILQEVRLP